MKDFDQKLLGVLISKILEADKNSALLLNTKEEISKNLLEYYKMVEGANKERNLVGASTINNFFKRHVVDSAQVLILIAEFCSKNNLIKNPYNVLDLGSGAGLPGLIILIFCKNLQIHFVEKSNIKRDFLQKSSSMLGLSNFSVFYKDRLESLSFKEVEIDFVTCRAFKSLKETMSLMLNAGLNAPLITLKGKNFSQELELASSTFRFEHSQKTSIVSDEGCCAIFSSIENKK